MRKANKNVWDVKQERDAGKARLINWGNSNKVEMQWGMSAASKKDQIFIITVGDKKAYLNSEEVMRFLRWV